MTAASAPVLQQQRQAVVVGDRVEVLVKSRERVKAYGEVFTPASMVNRMLDLVRPELETGPGFVDKTFFEPAAGDGNFLTVNRPGFRSYRFPCPAVAGRPDSRSA